jgi:hypothetical protein
MALCIACLLPGSQAAARDEAEAYRTIPLHQSQWNGTVVRVGNDAFNLDTCLSFGLFPLAGTYGACADAANDIMRAEGIGPIIKWVDDRVFFRIPKAELPHFNATQAHLRAEIARNGDRRHERGRWWYHAGYLTDGRIIECDEDMAFPIKDLSGASPRSTYEAKFTYGMEDIDPRQNAFIRNADTEEFGIQAVQRFRDPHSTYCLTIMGHSSAWCRHLVHSVTTIG